MVSYLFGWMAYTNSQQKKITQLDIEISGHGKPTWHNSVEGRDAQTNSEACMPEAVEKY